METGSSLLSPDLEVGRPANSPKVAFVCRLVYPTTAAGPRTPPRSKAREGAIGFHVLGAFLVRTSIERRERRPHLLGFHEPDDRLPG